VRTAALAAIASLAALPLIALAATNPLFDFGSYGEAQSSDTLPGEQTIDYAPAAEPAPAPRQSSLPLGVEEQVSVTMLPSVPSPGDTVRIRIDSYSTDLNKAATLWLKDGVTVSEGTGIVSFSFVAPAAGESTTVVFRAIKEGGGTIERSFTVAPADVDILYEALTYTPPLYRGKALFTNSAAIKFVAMPNFVVAGAAVPPESLVYTWRQNGRVVQSASGYGRQSFVVRGALVVNGIDIEVDVGAVRSSAKARARLSVDYASPQMLLYRKDPLLGTLFERSWSDQTSELAGTEFSLAAVPYFVDAAAASDPRLSYSWRVNGEASGQAGPIATFRKEGGGVARVATTLKHAGNFAQYAASEASVDLGPVEAVAVPGTAI